MQKCAALETNCDNTHIQGRHVALHAVPLLCRDTEMHYSSHLLSYDMLPKLTSRLHCKSRYNPRQVQMHTLGIDWPECIHTPDQLDVLWHDWHVRLVLLQYHTAT